MKSYVSVGSMRLKMLLQFLNTLLQKSAPPPKIPLFFNLSVTLVVSLEISKISAIL